MQNLISEPCRNRQERLVGAGSQNVHDAIGELQTKLAATEAALDRAIKERDYALRLLRQQQSLNTAQQRREALRAYFEDVYFYAKRNKIVSRIYTRLPIPLAFKEFLKSVLVKT
jgi:hypothetical protein